MAKVEYAPLVSQVSGRFQGIVFSRWRGIQTLRRFVSPSQPRTADQLSTRRAFRVANGAWFAIARVANTVLVESWRDAALHPATDRNAFIKGIVENLRTAQSLASFGFLAATRGTPLPEPSASGAVSAGTLTLTIAAYDLPSDYTSPTFQAVYVGPVDWTTYSGAAIPSGYGNVAIPSNTTATITISDVATGGHVSVCARALDAQGNAEYSTSDYYTVA